MSKFLVVISTSERDKALLGLRWAIAALKNKWAEDVEVVFFGPIEKSIAEGDNDLLGLIKDLEGLGKEAVACIRVAEAEGIAEKISEKNVKLGRVGELIAKYVDNGFIPLVF
jgi:hypothetical protein